MDQEKKTSQQPGAPLLDDQGLPVLDDRGQPVRWATRRQRVIALVLALVVVAITLACAYAISTGDFFRR